MSTDLIKKELQAITDKLAARWVACDEEMQELGRFTHNFNDLRLKKNEIDETWMNLDSLYKLCGENFYRVENDRFPNLTYMRHQQADAKEPC